ncbi:hypothetical protein MPHL43070_11620 [Mycolicibacterium phlei DSM 43070]|nr:hypothetical protein MPHL43070_11620 [Mycolicibacterium phlei DSM 43070]
MVRGDVGYVGAGTPGWRGTDGLVDGGTVGRGTVVGVRDVGGVLKLGSSIGGGATSVSCLELFTMTRAITSPTTVNAAMPASAHSQRGDFGFSGSGGGSPPGGYGGCPYWPVA